MAKMIILSDTRQQKENHITKSFDKNNIIYIKTKLPSADYMAIRYADDFYLDYNTLIDTKKDLLEICNNLAHTTEHQRVVREIELAHDLGCKRFIFLIGEDINSLDDIKKWENNHTKVRGETLLKIMQTFKNHHDCEFMFTPRNKMGDTIIKILEEQWYLHSF